MTPFSAFIEAVRAVRRRRRFCAWRTAPATAIWPLPPGSRRSRPSRRL